MSRIVEPSIAPWDHTKTTLVHAQPLRCLSDMTGCFRPDFSARLDRDARDVRRYLRLIADVDNKKPRGTKSRL